MAMYSYVKVFVYLFTKDFVASMVSSPRSLLGPWRWKWQAPPKPNYLQIGTTIYQRTQVFKLQDFISVADEAAWCINH